MMMTFVVDDDDALFCFGFSFPSVLLPRSVRLALPAWNDKKKKENGVFVIRAV